MKNKIVVIWDWNGTIVDDSFVFVKIMNLFLKEKSLPLIDVEQYKKYFEFPLINYYSRLGFDFNEESFEELGIRFIEQYKKHRFSANLFPGIKNLLSLLNNSGCSQFVVSAQEHSLLSSAVKHYALTDFFVDCCGVDNFFAFKKIEIAKQLKHRFISKGDRVFVVGDTLHDMEVAKALGARPVLVGYGHYAPDRLVGKGSPMIPSVDLLKHFLINNLKLIY